MQWIIARTLTLAFAMTSLGALVACGDVVVPPTCDDATEACSPPTSCEGTSEKCTPANPTEPPPPTPTPETPTTPTDPPVTEGEPDLGDLRVRGLASVEDDGTQYVVWLCLNEPDERGDYVEVTNIGTATIDQEFTVELGLYASESEIYLADYPLTSDIRIDPGAKAIWAGPGCVSVAVPRERRDYYFFAIADTLDQVAEADEENNIYIETEPLTIDAPSEGGPDLGDINFQGTYAFEVATDELGTYYNVSLCLNHPTERGDFLEVANVGTALLDSDFAVQLGLASADEVYVSDDLLTSDLSLEPGETATWEGPGCVSVAVPPGDWYVFILADALNQIAEADEDNNVLFYEEPLSLP